LSGLDVAHERSQGSAAHERAADRRETAARALQRAIALEQARACDATAVALLGVREERLRAAGLGPHVGIQDQDPGLGRGRDQGVLVLRERARALVDVAPERERARELGAAVGHVLAHQRRYAVARQRRQALTQEVALVVRDDRG